MLRTKLTLSTLATVMLVAGCSTQMVQPTAQKDVSATKVEAVKVNPNVIDLGYKNGTTLKVKVGVNGDKTPFGIKAATSGVFVPTVSDLGTKPGTLLKIKLHKVSNGSVFAAPMDRFNGSALVPEISFNGPFDGTTSPTLPLTLTFSGLQPGQDYMVSARLYDAPVAVPNLTVDMTGGVVVRTTPFPTAGNDNPVDFPSAFMFELNDMLKVGSNMYRVTNLSPLRVVDPVTGSTPTDVSNVSFEYQRNIVGAGNEGDNTLPAPVGKGMAFDGSGNGGGTASAGAFGPLEEIARVTPDGVLSILNDVAPLSSLDLKIQMRRNVNPTVTGSVNIVDGDPSLASESITTP